MYGPIPIPDYQGSLLNGLFGAGGLMDARDQRVRKKQIDNWMKETYGFDLPEQFGIQRAEEQRLFGNERALAAEQDAALRTGNDTTRTRNDTTRTGIEEARRQDEMTRFGKSHQMAVEQFLHNQGIDWAKLRQGDRALDINKGELRLRQELTPAQIALLKAQAGNINSEAATRDSMLPYLIMQNLAPYFSDTATPGMRELLARGLEKYLPGGGNSRPVTYDGHSMFGPENTASMLREETKSRQLEPKMTDLINEVTDSANQLPSGNFGDRLWDGLNAFGRTINPLTAFNEIVEALGFDVPLYENINQFKEQRQIQYAKHENMQKMKDVIDKIKASVADRSIAPDVGFKMMQDVITQFENLNKGKAK